MRQKGLDIGHVAKLLGHSSLAMSLLYAAEGEELAAIEAYRRVAL
jgi:site-specific recombinase XerD